MKNSASGLEHTIKMKQKEINKILKEIPEYQTSNLERLVSKLDKLKAAKKTFDSQVKILRKLPMHLQEKMQEANEKTKALTNEI